MGRFHKKLRRPVSVLLALAMVLSLFSAFDLSGVALATSVTTANATKPSGKPTLYIDFLGDSAVSGNYGGVRTVTGLENNFSPTTTDRSAEQNKSVSPGTDWSWWSRYGQSDVANTADMVSTVPGTVFWIGVGIDKMKLFELARDGRGLSGVELGFYYNPKYVVPWMGDTVGDASTYDYNRPDGYKSVITAANLGSNALNQWDHSLYHIEAAVPVADNEMDEDTQEYMTVRHPETNEKIRDFNLSGADSGWKMLYVSLEKNELGAASTNRFAAANTFTDTYSDSTIYYVMMLPFVLREYDAEKQICFRLARNASTFSMGGGDYGAAAYSSGFSTNSDDGLYDNAVGASFGAWERETRTVGHNLKEMFSFEGDLNIFTGKNQTDTAFEATLKVTGADSNNTARLYPSDASDAYVFVDDTGTATGRISGLTEGTGMTLDLVKASGVKAAVSVIRHSSGGDQPISYTEVKEGEKYTFTMPQSNVEVDVVFTSSGQTADEYRAQLTLTGVDEKSANTAQISGKGKDKDADTNKTSTSGASIGIVPGETVTIKVDRHPDYQAVVTVKTKSGSDVDLSSGTDVKVAPSPYAFPGANTTTSTAGAGTYTFTMPTADVEVTVAYKPLPSHHAELSVNFDSVNGNENNKARLSYIDYSEDSAGTTGEEKSVEWNGKTGGSGTSLGPIPQYREVRLDIALHQDYMVSAVKLYRKSDSSVYTLLSDELAKSLQVEKKTIDGTEYTKYLTLEMPDDTIQVAVEFARAQNFKATLKVVDGNGTDKAEMKGKDKNGGEHTAGPIPGGSAGPILIMTGNTVTVTCTPDPGAAAPRRVKTVEIITDNYLQPKLTYTGDPNQGPITFPMPGANVTVTVTFEEIPRAEYKARMQMNDSGTAYEVASTGWPDDPSLAASPVTFPLITGNHAGDLLTGWVQVASGWHIASVKAVGDKTGDGYPILTISGNGYNNGTGGKVVFTLSQPEEDVTVYVELKKGPPDAEPDQGLTLLVSDPDNTDADHPAVNWAKVDIRKKKDDGTRDWVGPQPGEPGVTKDYNSGNGYTDSNVTAGDPVKVTFGADTDYYVSKVEVTPSAYGVVPTWTGADTVEFTQPAGPATVTVCFAKKDADKAPKVYLHAVDYAVGEDAKLTLGTTITVPPGTPDYLTAYPGDTLTTDAVIVTHPDRKVKVEVFRGGSMVPWTSTGSEGEGKGTFVMPSGGDVHVYVTFYNEEDYPKGNLLTLSAWDTNTTSAKGTAGRAELYVAGEKFPSESGYTALSNDTDLLPAPVKGYVESGKTVKVIAKPEDGYVVDHITYTPAGSVSPVELAAPSAGGRTVEFTMPDNATAVEVWFRKGEATKHMANIVIWPPDGSTVAQVGDAWFADTTPAHTTAGSGPFSIAVAAGTALHARAVANDGYYISKIEITPAELGIASPITGIFATQTVDFVMPNADCIVNVYYEKGWPDELQAVLNVHGPSGHPGNTAQLIDATADPNISTSAVSAGDSDSLRPIAPGDVVKVKMTVETGQYVKSVSVKDSYGTGISYRWSGENEVSFDMPGTWVNVDVTFEEGTDPVSYKATLHDSANTASLTYGGNTVTGNSAELSGLHPGNVVTVTVPKPASGVPVVTVFRSDNNEVIATTALTLSGTSYTTTFPMQESNAEVYIAAVSPPKAGEHLAALIATQENGTTGGGSATMKNTVTGNSTTPTPVTSVSTTPGTVSAGDGAAMEITATPGTGYVVKSVVVTNDTTGATVPVALDGVDAGTYTYTYTMPDDPVTAVVTFKKWDNNDKLTAQVVVNNAGEEENKAVLRKDGDAEGTGQAMLTGLLPGDKVLVDLTVAPGHMVELITATPTAGGTVTVSTLLKPNNQDQTVHFFMPADDVIVYVKFVSDGKERYNVKMTVGNLDEAGNALSYLNTNTATLHTDFSGTKGPIKYADPQETVQVKGAATEVVTIETTPQPGWYAVVKAVSDDVFETPVSNLTVSPDKTTFTFSVPNNDVKVTVTFYPDSVEKPKHNVHLHIIKLDTNSDGTAGNGTVAVYDMADTSYRITEDAAFLTVPYLNNVKVDAQANDSSYLQVAYASFGGVVLPMINGTDHWKDTVLAGKAFEFLMQNGDVDVYVVFTDQKPAGPRTVSLTVTGPTGEQEGRAGSAILSNDKDPEHNKTGEVKSNKTFDPTTDLITANNGDSFTVRIMPKTGYKLDTVVVTPLKHGVVPTKVEQDAETGEWTYTFPYPNGIQDNLAVNVILTTTPVEKNTVTLHLNNPGDISETHVIYSEDDLKADGDSMEVPEREYVTVSVMPKSVVEGDTYYVHHAYAVTKSGEVLPLWDDPDAESKTMVTLQNLTVARTAKFVMPKEAVDVYVEYRSTDAPATGSHSAVLTATEPDNDNSGSSSVQMTEIALSESVTVHSDGVTSTPISTKKNDTMMLFWAGTIAPGFRVKSITITGDGSKTVYTAGSTELPAGSTQFSFPIPDYDIGVIVELEKAPPETYTATLHIQDHSSAIGNVATMTGGGFSVNVDGGKLTGLQDAAQISTVVTPKDSKVVVRAVIASDATGTHILTAPQGTYNYIINRSDVDITVVLDNADSAPEMYVATVEKTGYAALTGNTATIANTTTPALPIGPAGGSPTWTGVYAKDQVRVDVTTEDGFYAVITAKTTSGTTIPVLQLGTTGTVTGYVTMPDGLAENVIITVDYTTKKPTGKHQLTLAQTGSADGKNNKAGVKDKATAGTAVAMEVIDNSSKDYQVTGDTALVLTTTPADGWYVKEITLEVPGGAKITLPLDTGDFVMPLSDAKLTVTVKEGTRTARPHDWIQHNGAEATPPTANTDYVRGYLVGENLGSNRAYIRVPNLYDGTDTTPANNASIQYRLYVKEGGNYIPLTRGVDYEIISSNGYDYSKYSDTVNRDKLGTADAGWEFTIRSLEGESALTELLRKGTEKGPLLYITATEVNENGDPAKDESEYVEVTFPADPNAGKYTATLRIVDNSGKTGNAVEMSDGTTIVTDNGAKIQNLQGDELIRTVVTNIAAGARVSAVTVTDSAGTRLLDKMPTTTDRYPYYMTGEDITVTVYFETAESDDLTRYIATVTKTGGILDSGNDASIENDTRIDLAKGTIWAEGHKGNFMKVTVKLASGCYAEVTAYRKDRGPEAGKLPVTALGMGPGVTEFDAFFEMPDSDVQVIVEYTRVSPFDLMNKLTLELVDGGAPLTLDGDNEARLENTTGTPQIVLHANKDDYEVSEDTVAAGTKFSLSVKPDTENGYYVKEVLVYIPATSVTPAQTLSLMAHPTDAGEFVGSFTMPTKAAKVQVVFSKDPRTARPYDPNHSGTYNSDNYKEGDKEIYSENPDLSDPTQPGWIRAESADPADPDDPVGTDPDKLRNRILVTIPTLHDDESTDPKTALQNALQAVNNYQFYWKDSYGTYQKLKVKGVDSGDTDIAITDGKSAGAKTFVYDGTNISCSGYQFYLTALVPGGLMDYYIRNGGTIYVTAKGSSAPESGYTQIVIPKAYTATLRYSPLTDGINKTAKMYDGVNKTANGTDDKAPVQADGGQITGLSGASTEIITVEPAQPDPDGYALVGVVATTDSGSANATKGENKYTYTMANADVELRVVYNKTDDPLKTRGPHIVTVLKKDDGGLSGNTATVRDLDVASPPVQGGANGAPPYTNWTTAYGGNVVRVDVTTESGYYAVVTAKEVNKDSAAAIQVVQYGSYALFYMPGDCDVDVTVTYSTTKPDGKKLTLTLANRAGQSGNTATVTFPDSSTLVANSDTAVERSNVAVDTILKLTTDADRPDYSVASAEMDVGGVSIDIPLIDGKSLPDPTMPLSDAVITVTYQSGAQAPRPYDPKHSATYNGTADGGDYTTTGNPDRSVTHQEGWILAETDGKSTSVEITVPALYDFTVTGPDHRLSDAYQSPKPPEYNLYWRDEMGKFQRFTSGELTIETPIADGGKAYDPYEAATLTVKLKDQYALWGGYKFAEYLEKGGSVYITAMVDGKVESEKTEVVIFVAPKTYTATLKYVSAEGSAQMYGGSVTSALPVTASGGKIEALKGDETITVTGITPASGYKVAGVVAILDEDSSTVNVTETSAGVYAYQMKEADVTLQVVFKKSDDPIDQKKPLHIVTVYKTGAVIGANGDPGVSVADTDVDIPDSQKGDVWTAAYDGNVVRVDAAVKDGYYAEITARKHGSSTDDVKVAQFATLDGDGKLTSCYGLFYMPNDNDVDVTVKYVKADDLPTYKLTLTMTGSVAETGNNAEVKDKDTSPTLELKVTDVTANGLLTNSKDAVPAGTALELGTNVTSGWSIQSATMTTNGVIIDIPLISGKSLPVPAMPFGDALIEVTFVQKAVSGRPYDPDHSDEYKSTYSTRYKEKDDENNELNPDLSSSHVDGWLLAARNEDSSGFTLTVPALYDYTESTAKLSDAAVTGEAPVTDPVYTFYWRDELGKFQKFTTDDITVTGPVKNGQYRSAYDQATLTVTVNKTGTPSMPTLWGGYKLAEYLEGGGSIYVTATLGSGAESEMTEVVIQADTSAIRPYDPENTATDKPYDKNWITSENRGDYLVVTVPMLNTKEDTKRTDVDGKEHRFQLHLQKNGADRSSAIVNVTGLLDIVNVLDYDFGMPDSAYGGPGALNEYYKAAHKTAGSTYTYESYYENGQYYEKDGTKYAGARFIVAIKPAPVEPKRADYADDDAYAAAVSDYTTAKTAYDAEAPNRAILTEIIKGNNGTMGAKSYRMYITVDKTTNPSGPVPAFTNKDYVDFEVPRYYTFAGNLESYAPVHVTTFSLFPLKEAADGFTPDPSKTEDYKDKAAFTFTDYAEKGTDLWERSFALRSSALVSDTSYRLVIQKAGHVTFTWTNLLLSEGNLDGAVAPDDLTFTVAMVDETGSAVKNGEKIATGVIALFGGDADGDNRVTVDDYFYLTSYIGGVFSWNRSEDDTNTDLWPFSTCNPESPAYIADITGDRWISMEDASVWNLDRNFAKGPKDYEGIYYLRKTVPIVLGAKRSAPVRMAPTLEDMTAEELLDALMGETITLDDVLARAGEEQIREILALAAQAAEEGEEFFLEEDDVARLVDALPAESATSPEKGETSVASEAEGKELSDGEKKETDSKEGEGADGLQDAPDPTEEGDLEKEKAEGVTNDPDAVPDADEKGTEGESAEEGSVEGKDEITPAAPVQESTERHSTDGASAGETTSDDALADDTGKGGDKADDISTGDSRGTGPSALGDNASGDKAADEKNEDSDNKQNDGEEYTAEDDTSVDAQDGEAATGEAAVGGVTEGETLASDSTSDMGESPDVSVDTTIDALE